MRLRATFPLVVSLLLMAPRSARADTKDSCIAAAEEADVLRRDMTKLTKAQEKLRACAAEECPAVVRDDCRRWVVEVEANLPTVVLVATDESGKPTFDVRVSVDGQPLVDQLDGKPVVVDAGVHTFSFLRAGKPPLDVATTLRAGQKNVEVAAQYPRASSTLPAPAPASTPGTSPPALAERPLVERQDEAPRRSPLAYVGLGTGIVGVVGIGVGAFFGLRAASLQSDAHCPNNVCGPDGNPGTLRDAKASGNLSTAFLVGGGLLAAGGLAIFLFAPKQATVANATLRPSVGASGVSLTLEAFR